MLTKKCIKLQFVSKQDANEIRKYMRWYANFSKKGHNSYKMLDRVTSSCLQVRGMIVNKCAKFQSHMSTDFESI
jgi:hypothetical protein